MPLLAPHAPIPAQTDAPRPRRRRAGGRWTKAAAAVLLALHAGLGWALRPAGIETRQDDAAYVILAGSLADGRYHEEFRASAPPHRMYPPGYPALLAAWGGAFGTRFDAFAALGVAASTAALALVFAALRPAVGAAAALGTLGALSVNPMLVDFAGQVASEAPFMGLAALCLWLLAPAEPSPRRRAAAGAAAVAAAMVRSVGVTLVGAVALHWWLTGRRRDAAALAAAAAASVGGWIAWTAFAPERLVGKSYVADAVAGAPDASLPAVLAERLAHHVPWYASVGVPWTLPLPTVAGTPVDNVAGIAFAAAAGIAGLAVLWRRWRPAALTLLAYGALLAIWAWNAERFLVPVLPLLVASVVVGTGWIAGRLRPRWAVPATALAALLLAGTGAAQTAVRLGDRAACPRGGEMPADACLRVDQRSFFAALRDLPGRVPADAVVVSAKPEPLFLYTGRRTLPFSSLRDGTAETLIESMRDAGARWVLLGSLQSEEPTRLAPMLAARCDRFRVESVHPPRTLLLRLADAGEAGGDACAAIERYRTLNVNRDFARDP